MPLTILAVQRSKHLQLLVRFDAFRHYRQAKALRQGDNRADDFKALAVLTHRVDERAVDLKGADRQPVQVA
jgi:hypothetical protein